MSKARTLIHHTANLLSGGSGGGKFPLPVPRSSASYHPRKAHRLRLRLFWRMRQARKEPSRTMAVSNLWQHTGALPIRNRPVSPWARKTYYSPSVEHGEGDAWSKCIYISLGEGLRICLRVLRGVGDNAEEDGSL